MTEELKNGQDETEEDLLEADDEIISLVNEDGDTVNFYHAATLQHDEKWYIVLQPAEEMADIEDDEVVIFSLESDENGEDLLTPVEDEALLDVLFDKFVELTEGDDCDCDCEDESCSGCKCGCGEDHN